MRVNARAGLGLFAALSCGCPSLGQFACEEDAHCDRGTAGQCVAGDCAYEDASCPGSGLRFSPNARVNAGECVEAQTSTDGTSSGGAGSSSSGDETTASDSSGVVTTGEPRTCGSRKELRLDTSLLSPSESFPGYAALVVLEDRELTGLDPDGIFFTDDSDGVLAHELDAYDPSAGRVSAWVRLPEWEPEIGRASCRKACRCG